MRTMKRLPGILKLLSFLTALGLFSVTALADEGYNAPKLEGEFPWRAIGATAICFAGLLLVGLKNSRRSQQNTK